MLEYRYDTQLLIEGNDLCEDSIQAVRRILTHLKNRKKQKNDFLHMQQASIFCFLAFIPRQSLVQEYAFYASCTLFSTIFSSSSTLFCIS